MAILALSAWGRLASSKIRAGRSWSVTTDKQSPYKKSGGRAKTVAIADATVLVAGYFIGLRAASDPEAKTDLPRPIMVVHNDDKKATLAPEQNSGAVRFVNTRKFSLGIEECMRLWRAAHLARQL